MLRATEVTKQTNLTIQFSQLKRHQGLCYNYETQYLLSAVQNSLSLKKTIFCEILQIIILVIEATMEQDCQNFIFHSSSRWFVCDTSVQSLLLHCRISTPELPHFDTCVGSYVILEWSHRISSWINFPFWRQKLEELNFFTTIWSILFGLMNFVLNGISNFFASHLYTIKTKITDQGVH